MSEHEQDRLDREQRAAQDAVRSLGVPAADPAFRARLREQFVAGTVPERETPPARRRSPRVPFFFGLGTLAAAAVLAFAVVGLNRLPGPELIAVEGTGGLVIDGRSVDAGDTDRIVELLRPGVRLEVREETSVDLHYPGSMVWRVAAGSELVLPGRPGRWFGREVAAELAAGEVSVRTGPDLAGGRLDVATPTGTAAISGTLVNVFHNDELSCFCLFEGTARVLADGRDLGPIPPMKRWVVFADGREPALLDIAPPHLEHMKGLDEERAGVLDRE